MGKEVYAQKTDFIRLFWEKVVSDVSRWAWHTREQVINRKKPIFLKLALIVYPICLIQRLSISAMKLRLAKLKELRIVMANGV